MMRRGLANEDLLARGYADSEHAGFFWCLNEDGSRFIKGVEDWSPQALAARKGWSCRAKRDHIVYVCHSGGVWYLVKRYPSKQQGKHILWKEVNRAEQEFFRTLAAHKKGVPTVLPLAVGASKENRAHGIIIYPFLERAIPFERVYGRETPSLLSILDRQNLERNVGKLLRTMVDAGAYPIDGHLDHFLAQSADGKIGVYYIDLERVRFSAGGKPWFLRRKRAMTIGRLLARLEWFRVSGGRINCATMMRIAHAFFAIEGLNKLDKKRRRVVLKAARRYWDRRKFHSRGSYGLRSLNPTQ